MSDLITIDRQFVLDAISIGLSGYITDDDMLTLEGMGIAVSEMPPAQLEIIRCKDCTAYGEMLIGRDTRMICHKFALNFPRDFYCADAERRTDG